MAKKTTGKNMFKSVTFKVTRMDFSATHPDGIPFESDAFYTALANRLYKEIDDMFKKNSHLTPDVSKRLAITLACYVEDLVAGSGIWSAFTSLSEKMYGTKLPFFNLNHPAMPAPYDDEYPSLYAVQFLVWYVVNGVKPDTVMNPMNPALSMLSMQLLPMLTEAYENAPESPARFAIIPEEELGMPVFFQVRNLCNWLCTRCYLTRIRDISSLSEPLVHYISKILNNTGDSDKGKIDYAVESYMPLNTRIGPLALPAYEWLAEIVDLYHDDEEEQFIPLLREMKSRPYGYYKYKSVGTDTATIVDIAGEELTLSATTLPGERFMPQIEEGMGALMSLVYFDGTWVMNSLGIQALDVKAYEDAAEEYRKKQDNDKNVYEMLMKNLGGKRIGVCADYKEYLKKAYGEDAPESKVDPDMLKGLNDSDNLLYFINSDGTASILPDYGECVKLSDNPFYDKDEATNQGISLICCHDMSTPEMRRYLIDNDLIPDAAMSSIVSEETGRKLFQRNIRFFNDYFSRDSMKLVSEM